MKRLLMTVMVVAVIFAASSAAHAEITMFSGKTQGPHSALNISAGVPDLSVLFLSGLDKRSDLGVLARLGYLTPVGFHINVWLMLDAEYKYMIRDAGKYNVAIKGDFGINMSFYSKAQNFDFGLNLQPYLIFGVPIKDAAMINLGFGVPFAIWFIDGIAAQVPIAFTFGAEFFVDPQTTINVNCEVGPGIIIANSFGQTQSTVDFYGLFKVGVSFDL